MPNPFIVITLSAPGFTVELLNDETISIKQASPKPGVSLTAEELEVIDKFAHRARHLRTACLHVLNPPSTYNPEALA